tara:strand:+ start:295 stop:1245 length:951 start_codon:yes stop_codon:yes gene_type:complete
MKVAFYSPHLCLRGTTVAMYDYAYYNEKLLGNESIIFYDKDHQANNDTTIEKFTNVMECVPMDSINDIDKTIVDNQVDAIYIIKGGFKNDGRMAHACKTLIHAVAMAPESEAHGDVYAYGSYWLSEACSEGRLPAVPHMVDLPDINDDLRDELLIPKDAIVFGRSGGLDTWNLPFASEVIQRVLNERDDIYFVFQNTPMFYMHPNIIYIQPTSDMEYKVKFINTCDAMIHARNEGESFGLSCGEFSIRNKPVITWNGSKERNHIYVLGDKGIYYSNAQEMYDSLINFKPEPNKDWNCYRDYSPENIMKIFQRVYLR